MWVEIPNDAVKVSKDVFEQALEDWDYRRSNYANVSHYLSKDGRAVSIGYLTSKGEYYLCASIIGGVDAK